MNTVNQKITGQISLKPLFPLSWEDTHIKVYFSLCVYSFKTPHPEYAHVQRFLLCNLSPPHLCCRSSHWSSTTMTKYFFL